MLVDIRALVGKTLESVDYVYGYKEGLTFKCDDGYVFEMYHDQDCCESVDLDDITEGWKDILNGSTVLDAYESNSDLGPKNQYDESYTWTFYRIITTKGTVVLRWYGTSNGYYSESVSIYQVSPSPQYDDET